MTEQKNKLIKNYTTDVPVKKTIEEIHTLLAQNGATGIATEYESGLIKDIFFKIKYQNRELAFRLPAKPQEVYDALFKGMQYEDRLKQQRMQKASMIAWRICKTWLEAQLTLINLKQAQIQEVFLPYLVMPNNQTLYEHMKGNQFLLSSG